MQSLLGLSDFVPIQDTLQQLEVDKIMAAKRSFGWETCCNIYLFLLSGEKIWHFIL